MNKQNIQKGKKPRKERLKENPSPASYNVVFIWSMAPADHYYEQANPDLLYRIPVNANAVLEIGCGAGALGREYKSINPDATYIGIELMAGPAAQARKLLDYVYECDISDQKIVLPEGIEGIDCMVFGDVLEHLVNPTEVLQKLLPFLKPNGVLLICIPNAQHWSMIANLLTGKWPQEDQGLFDKTHLRWFTKESIIDLMKILDMEIQEIKPRIFKPEQARNFVSAMQPSLEKLGLNPQTVLDGAAPLQYVVRATKEPTQKMRIDGLMLAPQAGMNEVRMIQPLRNVASIPGIELNLSSNEINLLKDAEETAKIMIWQRQLLTYNESLERLRIAVKAGYILISEFDDDPDHWPAIKENKDLNFRGMHAVQVSTKQLANQIGASNPNIVIFENCLERIPYQNKEKWEEARSEKQLRVFFGALNRKKDWSTWIEAINKVYKKYPNSLEFDVVHDQEFFQALKSEKKRFTPTCNYSMYLQRLEASHISLLPLMPTKFNEKKSDLKFVESAGCGVAAIASPTVYRETIQDLRTGVLCQDEEHLFRILEDWINNPEKPNNIANNAYTWCKNNRLQKTQTERRVEWYRSLWEQREELTNELLKRVPELEK